MRCLHHCRRILHASHILRRGWLHILLFHCPWTHRPPIPRTRFGETLQDVDHHAHHFLLRQSVLALKSCLCAARADAHCRRVCTRWRACLLSNNKNEELKSWREICWLEILEEMGSIMTRDLEFARFALLLFGEDDKYVLNKCNGCLFWLIHGKLYIISRSCS